MTKGRRKASKVLRNGHNVSEKTLQKYHPAR
jgi:hypothetical protein